MHETNTETTIENVYSDDRTRDRHPDHDRLERHHREATSSAIARTRARRPARAGRRTGVERGELAPPRAEQREQPPRRD